MSLTKIALMSNYFTAFCLSLLFNGLIVIISARKATQGDFKYVLILLATTDIILSCVFVLIMPSHHQIPGGSIAVFAENDLTAFELAESMACQRFVDFGYLGSIIAKCLCSCLLSLQRYMVICKMRNKFLTLPLHCLLTFLLIYMGAICLCLPNVLGNGNAIRDLRSDANFDLNFSSSACAYYANITENRSVLFGSLMAGGSALAANFVTGFCTIKLVFHLRNAHRNVQSMVNEQMIARQKSLLYTIIIHAFAPLISAIPLLVAAVGFTGGNGISDTSLDLVSGIFVWNPTIEALAIFYFVKPYRKGLKRVCHIVSSVVATTTDVRVRDGGGHTLNVNSITGW